MSKNQQEPRAVQVSVNLPGALYKRAIQKAEAAQSGDVKWGRKVNFSRYVQNLIALDDEMDLLGKGVATANGNGRGK